ncbi:hypothetical protein BD626DRAFT_99394 [Schizophyllum amplum]|uniref:Uncharacterized protein n=1 Tax=Schizophyllum amplum TaxID=97359 RepID=A0A550CRB2_9AGAR|nr:hypothetical protein BD626DRAFT_99394 [Auriculariopsis ampla]
MSSSLLPCRQGCRRCRRASALRDDNRGMRGAERIHHSVSLVVHLDAVFATRLGLEVRFEIPLRRCVDIVDRGENRAWLWPRTRRWRAAPLSPYFLLWIKWYGLGDGAGGHDAAGQWRRRRGRRPRMGAARNAAIYSDSGGMVSPPTMCAAGGGETRIGAARSAATLSGSVGGAPATVWEVGTPPAAG